MVVHIEVDDLILSVKYDNCSGRMLGVIVDTFEVKVQTVQFSWPELSAIIAMMVHPDAQSVPTQEAYDLLQDCIKRHGWDDPDNKGFRPIP